MKLDVFEPFRKTSTRTRPILTYTVGVLFMAGLVLFQDIIGEYKSIAIFVLGEFTWVGICRKLHWI